MSSSGARTCARPFCGDAASATLSYSYDSGTVWLDPLFREAHPMVHDMCATHADAVSVPMGWRLVDRRVEVTVTRLAAG